MSKVLVLATNIERYIGNTNGAITEIYRNNTQNKLIRLLRKLFFSISFMPQIWLNTWYKNCSAYDAIVLFDTGNAKFLINIIRKKVPGAKIILWYWNSVEKTLPVKDIDRSKCEIWSYNKRDCKKYGLQYNTQFYINHIKQDLNINIKQDVYFVGADKNRTELLYNLQQVFEKKKITYKFILTQAGRSKESKVKYSNPITAEENIKNILESYAIIDLVDDNQKSGITLRPFEAAYYKKKLITNDKTVKTLKFYSQNNIFIVGIDSFESLKEFIALPFVEHNVENLLYYEYSNWLKRFLEMRG